MTRIDCGPCVLREWVQDDREALVRHANDIRVWNNVRDYFPHPYTMRDAGEYLALVAGKAYVQDFAVEVGGQAVGGVGFVPGTDVERLSAEVGYWLGETYRGRGIATAALKGLSEYIFHTTDIVRLWAGVFDFNRASQRVLEKAGYTHLCTMHRAAVKNGRIIDLEYYELLKPCI